MANQSPTIINKTLTNADTEYSQELPADCRRWSLQCRTAYDVRLSFVTGKVAGSTAPFATVKSGCSLSDQPSTQTEIVGQLTLFLASSQAGVVVEILCWN